MNVRQMSIAVAIVGCGWAAWAEGASNESIRISMELDLVDGSRLIGTPGIATVPVQTSYAKMDVPLMKIQSLKIGADHETVILDLSNGDTLTGVISLAPIKLETLFGPVSIGIEHIKQFTIVRTGGALPESLRTGLILYNGTICWTSITHGASARSPAISSGEVRRSTTRSRAGLMRSWFIPAHCHKTTLSSYTTSRSNLGENGRNIP